tara:strand:+ start:245 stop:907 length:663 start_codon:yes stop_codon:yes gene_type:complete
MKSRVITASIAMPILFAVIYMGGIWFSVSILLLALIGSLELINLSKKIGFKSSRSILVICSSVILFVGSLTYGILLRNDDNGVYLAYWLIAVVIVSDTCAFFIGRRLGKHKLAPNISPMKTIEGAIGGILGAVIASLAIKYIFTELEVFSIDISVSISVIGGVLIGCIGIIGDLGESKLKRMAGVKDSGTIFPGHGGVLDRLDSVLLNLPVTYYGFIWIS